MKIYLVRFRRGASWWIYALISAIVIIATALGIILEPLGIRGALQSAASDAIKTVVIDPGHGERTVER